MGFFYKWREKCTGNIEFSILFLGGGKMFLPPTSTWRQIYLAADLPGGRSTWRQTGRHAGPILGGSSLVVICGGGLVR